LSRVVSAIGGTVQLVLSDIPAGLAEDVVRGQVRLSGGAALLPGLAARLGEVAGIGVLVAEDPLRCVVRRAAVMLTAGGAPGIPAR
jgi:actin-like ATPase involved in cell morphogenesis